MFKTIVMMFKLMWRKRRWS